jgi:hypothetical protein
MTALVATPERPTGWLLGLFAGLGLLLASVGVSRRFEAQLREDVR